MHRFLNLLWLAKFIKTVTRDNDFILYQIAITKLLAQKNTKQKLFTKATSIEFVNGARWTDNYYRELSYLYKARPWLINGFT